MAFYQNVRDDIKQFRNARSRHSHTCQNRTNEWKKEKKQQRKTHVTWSGNIMKRNAKKKKKRLVIIGDDVFFRIAKTLNEQTNSKKNSVHDEKNALSKTLVQSANIDKGKTCDRTERKNNQRKCVAELMQKFEKVWTRRPWTESNRTCLRYTWKHSLKIYNSPTMEEKKTQIGIGSETVWQCWRASLRERQSAVSWMSNGT